MTHVINYSNPFPSRGTPFTTPFSVLFLPNRNLNSCGIFKKEKKKAASSPLFFFISFLQRLGWLKNKKCGRKSIEPQGLRSTISKHGSCFYVINMNRKQNDRKKKAFPLLSTVDVHTRNVYNIFQQQQQKRANIVMNIPRLVIVPWFSINPSFFVYFI